MLQWRKSMNNQVLQIGMGKQKHLETNGLQYNLDFTEHGMALHICKSFYLIFFYLKCIIPPLQYAG